MTYRREELIKLISSTLEGMGWTTRDALGLKETGAVVGVVVRGHKRMEPGTWSICVTMRFENLYGFTVTDLARNTASQEAEHNLVAHALVEALRRLYGETKAP
jgi:hypothetical protein